MSEEYRKSELEVPNINAWKIEREARDRRNYQNMYEKSVSGSEVRRTHKKRKSDYKKSHKKLKMLLGATVVGAAITLGITGFTSHMKDNAVINGLASDFHDQVIRPETHRTDDFQHYYYDYMDILQSMKQMDDFDAAVFFLSECVGEYQTGEVLKLTDYGSFDGYMQAKGFSDAEEFSKEMRERILLEEDVYDKSEELSRMLQADTDEDINIDVMAGGIGGK